MTTTEVPRTVRTRPKERKQHIQAAASGLFVEHGFHAVTMSMIADRVGITAGALYRHYKNKADLLAAVVIESVESFPLSFTRDQSLDDVLGEACQVAVRHRDIAPLWTQQVPHLPEETQAQLRDRLRDANRAYVGLIRASRPELSKAEADLLALGARALLASPGRHSVVLPAAEFADLLTAVCRRLCNTALVRGDGPVRQDPPDRLQPASRRERLLQEALLLFGQKGYEGTSMEDIGTAAGVRGPSLYVHFDSKEDILRAAIDRATHANWLSLDAALRTHDEPCAALRALLAGYVEMTKEGLTDTSFAVADHLADDLRVRRREYVDEWVALLRACRPELGQPQARVTVQSALSVVNDLSRTPHLASADSFSTNVTAMATAVLGIDRLPTRTKSRNRLRS